MFAFLVLFLLYCFYSDNVVAVVISTKLGQIRGIENNTAWKPKTIYEFRGISYATPPIANLRFRQSKLNTSKWNNIYDGATFGSVCVQSSKPPNGQTMDEDCLYLNIWTTKSNVDNANTSLVPVMVYIHGGGFHTGEGSDPQYNGINFVGEYGDFVYVSINYRLNSLGFLNNQAIYNEDPNFKTYGGMNGIYDQIVALEWINAYISDYGGDSNQITIFGQSAGGESVCYLLVSPLANDLFQRGIVQSGACNGAWGCKNMQQGISYGNSQLQSAGYPIDNLTYLRSIDANTFIQKVGGGGISVDGLIMTDTPINIYAKSDTKLAATDAVIYGSVSLDGVIGWPWYDGPAPKNDEQYQQFIDKYVSNKTQQQLLYNVYYPPSDFPDYPPNHNSYDIAWFTMNSDVCVMCPTLQMAQQVVMNEMTAKTYVYYFLGSGLNDLYYAPHGSEIPFIFDRAMDINIYDMPWNQNLSDSMLSAWINFGKYGVPNITNKFDNVDILWNEFDVNEQSVLAIKQGNEGIVNVKNFKQSYRKNVCDFWFNEVGLYNMMMVCWD